MGTVGEDPISDEIEGIKTVEKEQGALVTDSKCGKVSGGECNESRDGSTLERGMEGAESGMFMVNFVGEGWVK